MDEPASAEQDHWKEIAAAVRTQLAKYAALMPAMKPDELKTLVDACREAVRLELDATLFDEEVEEMRGWMRRRAAYGE
jgi:hypothetical protein